MELTVIKAFIMSSTFTTHYSRKWVHKNTRKNICKALDAKVRLEEAGYGSKISKTIYKSYNLIFKEISQTTLVDKSLGMTLVDCPGLTCILDGWQYHSLEDFQFSV